MFNDQQLAQLNQPLDKKNVKQRKGSAGKQLSYIEAWHAIAEANRIFGFSNWNRTLKSLECVDQGKRSDGKSGYIAHYIATVRIIVHTEGASRVISREGTGYGNSYGFTQGEAHEVAAKEAESDAMKRALMTFGNPFGLALYDKAQTQVAANVPEIETEPPESPTPKLPETPSHATVITKGQVHDLLESTKDKALWDNMLDSYAICLGESYLVFESKDYHNFLKKIDYMKAQLDDETWYRSLTEAFDIKKRTDIKDKPKHMTLFYLMLADEVHQRKKAS
jgi:DNA recombination protein Rad52